MILRVLILAVLVFLAYHFIRRAVRRLAPPQDDATPSQASQPIVPCKVCGTFVPRNRALFDEEGHAYCSEACRRSQTPQD